MHIIDILNSKASDGSDLKYFIIGAVIILILAFILREIVERKLDTTLSILEAFLFVAGGVVLFTLIILVPLDGIWSSFQEGAANGWKGVAATLVFWFILFFISRLIYTNSRSYKRKHKRDRR